MFSYIKGILAQKSNGVAVVDVGGIGYKIYTDDVTLNSPDLKLSGEVTFYTHLYIKEGIMDIYGFTTQAQLDMFLMLISVNGVGAKGAISIMSVATPEKLALSIATDDISLIKKASGIGAKTAQRICLELKGKIKNEALVSSSIQSDIDYTGDGNIISEAVTALVTLGYTQTEAQKAVSGINGDSVEDIIKKALKTLM